MVNRHFCVTFLAMTGNETATVYLLCQLACTIRVLHLPRWKMIFLYTEPKNPVSKDEVAHDMPIRIISCWRSHYQVNDGWLRGSSINDDNQSINNDQWWQSIIIDEYSLFTHDNNEQNSCYPLINDHYHWCIMTISHPQLIMIISDYW